MKDDWAKELWMQNPSETNWEIYEPLNVEWEPKKILDLFDKMGYMILEGKSTQSFPCKDPVKFLVFPEGSRNSVEISYDGMFYGTAGEIPPSNLEDMFNNP